MTEAQHQFDGARLKISRAEKHMAELKAYLETLPGKYQPTTTQVEDGGHVVRFEIPNPLEIRQTIAIIAGDALNNLKSALDYAWIGLLQRHQVTLPKKPKFPVYDEAHGLEDYLIKNNVPNGSQIFNYMMNTCRPYEHGQTALWAMHKLNNHDKHKLIMPTMSYAGVTEMKVHDKESGIVIPGSSWGMDDDGPFEFYFQPSLEVHNMGKLSVSFLVAKGLPWHPTSVDSMLVDFKNTTKYIVDQMEVV